MKDFRLAMAQGCFPQANSVDQNLHVMDGLMRTAADDGAQVVVFGELCMSGYLLDTTGLTGPAEGSSEHYRRAEEIPGPATRILEEMARSYGLFAAAGMSDIEAGVVYNAFLIVGPNGYIGKQRKLHMPPVEYRYYGTGSEASVFDIGLCKLGMCICFDNWFPEVPRMLALQGAEIMLSPWMWRIPSEATVEEKRSAADQRRQRHKRFFPSRALDNAMYVIVVDHVGEEADGFEMPGVSMAIDPAGVVIAETTPLEEQALTVEIKASEIEKSRTYGHQYTLQFRRPEIYSRLTERVK